MYVFRRAFKDASAFLGTNPRRAIVGIIVTSLAAPAFAYCLGPDKAMEKLIWAAVILAATWAVFLAVYIPFVIRTPYLLHREQSRQYGEHVDHLQANATALESERNQLTSDLVKARKPDPDTTFRRRELEKLLSRFRELIRKLELGQHGSVAEFYAIDTDGKNFVDREFAGYRYFTSVHPFSNTYTSKIKYDKKDFDVLIGICRDRISKLEELLGHFE